MNTGSSAILTAAPSMTERIAVPENPWLITIWFMPTAEQRKHRARDIGRKIRLRIRPELLARAEGKQNRPPETSTGTVTSAESASSR